MLKALVVDDNEVNTLVLSTMLELFYIEADHADSGEKALEKLKSKSFDILFIDHIMPGMDGINTSKEIRRNLPNSNKPVIIALTSNVTDHIIKQYHEAGADAVFNKPLSLTQIIALLKRYYPDFVVKKLPEFKETYASAKILKIKNIINKISEVDYSAGLKFAAGNPIQYMNILKVSSKDIQLGINSIIKYKENHTMENLRLTAHNLISVFTNIGALLLADQAKCLELSILRGEIQSLEDQCEQFQIALAKLKEKLMSALQSYDEFCQSEIKSREIVIDSMSKEEYEQCLLITIYYIKRYEYDAIVIELEKLIARGQEAYRQEFQAALSEIKLFEYEKALIRLRSIS